MTNPFKTVLFSFLLISLFSSTSSQTCNNYTFSSNIFFTQCTALPYLNAFLHWTYHRSTGTVDIAYRHTGISSSGWVAWALNLKSQGMIGAQCLVALHNSNGLPYAYTSSIDSYDTSLGETPVSFPVQRLSAEYVSSEMIIFATLVLPNNQTSFHQVWNDGPVSGGTPQSHLTTGDNLKSLGSVDFASGNSDSSIGSGVSQQQKKKNAHGVLNTLSWGTLMPIGAMTARYMKVFKSADPAWFYLHVACQCSAYIIGVAGWATGLTLGNNTGIHTRSHGNIGMTLFILGTLQVCALLLRPKKDHTYRIYWNIYHWSVGYLVIILSIVNIFEGFDILDPAQKWKRAYIGILIFLGLSAAFLEMYTWYVVLERKERESQKYPNVRNGACDVMGVELAHNRRYKEWECEVLILVNSELLISNSSQFRVGIVALLTGNSISSVSCIVLYFVLPYCQNVFYLLGQGSLREVVDCLSIVMLVYPFVLSVSLV